MATRRGPDGSARVAVSGLYGNEPWANVFWANLTGGSTATQAGFDAFVLAFGEAYYNGLGPLFPSTVTITQAQGTLFQPNSQALHSIHTMAHAGPQSGNTVQDLAACRVLSWTTGVYWRGGKPRTYVPAVMEAESQDWKTLTTAARTGIANAGTNFHSQINAITATGITQTQHGFVSFRSGNADRPVGLFFPILGCQSHGRIGTQRRRLGPWIP